MSSNPKLRAIAVLTKLQVSAGSFFRLPWSCSIRALIFYESGILIISSICSTVAIWCKKPAQTIKDPIIYGWL